MLFKPCTQLNNYHQIPQLSLNSDLLEYDELNVTKICNYFEGMDFFDLAYDDVDSIDRLVTRSLKPKTSQIEVEEIIELIQNLGISALLKRNVEVYQASCNGLWKMGKKYIPLIMAADKQDLSNNFHLRLKLWTSLYRVCRYPSFEKLPCKVLDCTEEDFDDGISLIHFGSLMIIAKFKESIPCSCVLTSWKVMIPTSLDKKFADIFYGYFNLQFPSFAVDDPFFKAGYAMLCSLPKELFIKMFYSLFPAFFQNLRTAGGCLKDFHSKIPAFSTELYLSLIDCFSQNVTFISCCAGLLEEFTKKINIAKDEITVNYFPADFSAISNLIDEYSLKPKLGDDKFQLFFRLFVRSLNDFEIGKKLVSTFDSYWGKSKVPKIYSFYLMLLAITAKILGPQFVLEQVGNLTGDDICPQESLFLRFLVLQRTSASDFRQTFDKLKAKITLSSTNFSSFVKAFPLTAATHSSEMPLLFTLFSNRQIRCLSTDNLSTFIKEIRRLPFIPSFIFEQFHKNLDFEMNFVVRFFAFQLSASSIPSIEKVFDAKFITSEFIEKLVEATVRQNKTLSRNLLFGYQLAVLYLFTRKFLMVADGKQYFSKFIKLISQTDFGMINESKEAIEILDKALNGNVQLSSGVFTKWIFEIIDNNFKHISECVPNACEQMCEILLCESFVKSSNAFNGTSNGLPLSFLLNGFIKRYLIQDDFSDNDYQIKLLEKLKMLQFPKLLTNATVFVDKFKKNLKSKIEDLSF